MALRQARRENDFGVDPAAVHCAPRERRNTHDSGLCACVCLYWESRIQIHAQEPSLGSMDAREPGALPLADLVSERSGGRAHVPVRPQEDPRVFRTLGMAGAESAARVNGNAVDARPHARHAGRVQMLRFDGIVPQILCDRKEGVVDVYEATCSTHRILTKIRGYVRTERQAK